MSDFVVPISNSEGIKVRRTGRTYYPDRRGNVTINNPRDIAEIKASDAKNKFDMIKEKSYTMNLDPEVNRCESCLFAAQPFSTLCPRCGHDLPLKAKE